VESFPSAFEAFQAVSWRGSQILQFSRIMQIEQLSPRHTTQLGWKRSRGSCSLIVEQILGQSVSEGFNHITILSEFDNQSRRMIKTGAMMGLERGAGVQSLATIPRVRIKHWSNLIELNAMRSALLHLN